MEAAVNLGEAMGLWVVVLLGCLASLTILYFGYMWIFEKLIRAFKIHRLFVQFMYERLHKRPPTEYMSDEETAELKRTLGR